MLNTPQKLALEAMHILFLRLALVYWREVIWTLTFRPVHFGIYLASLNPRLVPRVRIGQQLQSLFVLLPVCCGDRARRYLHVVKVTLEWPTVCVHTNTSRSYEHVFHMTFILRLFLHCRVCLYMIYIVLFRCKTH